MSFDLSFLEESVRWTPRLSWNLQKLVCFLHKEAAARLHPILGSSTSSGQARLLAGFSLRPKSEFLPVNCGCVLCRALPSNQATLLSACGLMWISSWILVALVDLWHSGEVESCWCTYSSWASQHRPCLGWPCWERVDSVPAGPALRFLSCQEDLWCEHQLWSLGPQERTVNALDCDASCLPWPHGLLYLLSCARQPTAKAGFYAEGLYTRHTCSRRYGQHHGRGSSRRTITSWLSSMPAPLAAPRHCLALLPEPENDQPELSLIKPHLESDACLCCWIRILAGLCDQSYTLFNSPTFWMFALNWPETNIIKAISIKNYN